MRSCFSGTTGLRTMCIQSCLIKIDEYAFFNSSIQRFEVAQLMKMEFEEDSSGDDENKILIDDESERLSDDEGSRVDEESDEDYQPYIGIQHKKSQVVVDNYNKAMNSGQIDYIAKYAFSESKLEEIVFKLKNYSINNIKKGGFKNCKYLKRIPAIFGTIFPFAISGADINTITLQAKKISTNAITYCKSLKVIIIEKTVEDLGPKFFDFCDNVETLIFADGDQLLEIKEASFQLYKFINVNFGNRVSVIGAYAFMQSSISGTLELPAGLKVIKERAFESCKNLDGMLIFDKCNKLEYLGSGCFQACSGFIGQLKLPESVTYIGPNCFAECKFCGDIIIPDKVVNISHNCFYKCQDFSGYIKIGKSVKYIGKYAFAECSGISSIIEFDNMDVDNITIDSFAFYGCNSISGSLILPNSVVYIGEAAFYGCSDLSNELILPSQLKYLDKYAFAYCKGFTGYITIPKSIEVIGEHCFQGC